jgi:hypothetical protein
MEGGSIMTKTKTVSLLEKYAFMLDNSVDAFDSLTAQDILHALIPNLAKRNRLMPKGATGADFWILKNGNPLASLDAALIIVREIFPDARLVLKISGYMSYAEIATDMVPFDTDDFQCGEFPTATGAVMIALLKMTHNHTKGGVA